MTVVYSLKPIIVTKVVWLWPLCYLLWHVTTNPLPCIYFGSIDLALVPYFTVSYHGGVQALFFPNVNGGRLLAVARVLIGMEARLIGMRPVMA